MSIETRMLKQDALYWGPPVENGDGGFDYPDPVEIKCRWEEVVGEAKDTMSHERVKDSTVYVDRDVEVDGYLCFDESLSAVEGVTADKVEGAVRIKGFQKTPNFRATKFLRVVTI